MHFVNVVCNFLPNPSRISTSSTVNFMIIQKLNSRNVVVWSLITLHVLSDLLLEYTAALMIRSEVTRFSNHILYSKAHAAFNRY